VSDDELVARINMADAKFSFQEKGKIYQPAWVAPEVEISIVQLPGEGENLPASLGSSRGRVQHSSASMRRGRSTSQLG
jgi:hypothetical protein